MTFLDQTCGYCRRPYRTQPCRQSDHYRTCIDLAYDAAERPYVSSGCTHPAQQQAPIDIDHRGRRHPHDGPRPEFSGYCVTDRCACPCHHNEAHDEIGIGQLAETVT